MKRIILIMLLLWGTAFAVNYPLTVTDELGNTVTVPEEPMRVISMIPSYSETICALNACDKLIGVDSFSDYPPELNALPKLGSGLTGFDNGPDIEAIVALEPDLVLVSEYGELATLLRQAGLTVYAGSPQTLEDIYASFSLVGELLNQENEAALLKGKVSGEIAAIEAITARLEHPKVYYEIDPTPYSIGPNSFIGILLGKAGADNIVPAELGEFPQLDPEFIVAANPDIIILGDAPYGETPEGFKARPGFAALAGQIVPLSETEANLTGRAGPRVAAIVKLFASILHPELF